MSLDDSLMFWRNEFGKAMAPDKFEKQYAYNIRYVYVCVLPAARIRSCRWVYTVGARVLLAVYGQIRLRSRVRIPIGMCMCVRAMCSSAVPQKLWLAPHTPVPPTHARALHPRLTGITTVRLASAQTTRRTTVAK
jgi:DNA primase large subunit